MYEHEVCQNVVLHLFANASVNATDLKRKKSLALFHSKSSLCSVFIPPTPNILILRVEDICSRRRCRLCGVRSSQTVKDLIEERAFS